MPSIIPVLFNLASVNLRRGNDEKAKGYYLEILKTDSSNFNVYKQLANLYPGQSDPEKISYLEKANKLNPAEADVAYDLATGYNLLKQDKQAYQVLDPALKADTGNFILLKVKLPVCMALLKFPEAGLIGIKLMAGGDSTSSVITTMGKLSVLTKSFQKAIGYFKLLELWGQENETSLYYTALCYRELKNYKEAAAYTLKTIEFSTSPNMASYYTLLGTVYEEKLQYKPAITAYKKGLEYTSKGGIYYNMALLEDLKLNEPAKALTHYRLYLKSKPDPEKNKDAILYVKDRISKLAK
jgi:tetratricopeptide (TPR) repeat protein